MSKLGVYKLKIDANSAELKEIFEDLIGSYQIKPSINMGEAIVFCSRDRIKELRNKVSKKYKIRKENIHTELLIDIPEAAKPYREKTETPTKSILSWTGYGKGIGRFIRAIDGAYESFVSIISEKPLEDDEEVVYGLKGKIQEKITKRKKGEPPTKQLDMPIDIKIPAYDIEKILDFFSTLEPDKVYHINLDVGVEARKKSNSKK